MPDNYAYKLEHAEDMFKEMMRDCPITTISEFKAKLHGIGKHIKHLRKNVEDYEKHWENLAGHCEFRIDGELDCIIADDPVCGAQNCPLIKKEFKP